MRKSSLGRRSATGISRTGSLGPDSTRKSGIPVKVQSVDRNTVISNYRNSKPPVAATPKTPQCYNQYLPTGSARPYRAMTMSTESSRASSIGGSKGGKKDSRPLHEKDWQNSVERRIYSYFYEEGSNIITNSNIKQMSTNQFIDVVNCLFKKLDPFCEVNKANYKQELPFLLKRCQYPGKVDKSFLSTVNAPHSWPYALGILHFLLEAVECTNVDPESLLFPEFFDAIDDGDDYMWDHKKLLPYYTQKYQIYSSGPSDAKELMDRLEDEIIREHFTEDIFESVERYEKENKLLEEKVTELECEKNKLETDIMSIENMISTLDNDLRKECQYSVQLEGYIKNLEDKNKGSEMDIRDLEGTWSKRNEKKEKLKEELNALAISQNDIEQIKEKRDLLIMEIESEKRQIEEHSNLVFAEDMKIVSLKKQLESSMKEYNAIIANLMEVEPSIEKIKLDSNVLDINVEEIVSSFDSVFKNSKEKFEQFKSNLDKKIKQSEAVKTQVQSDLNFENKIVEEMKTKLDKVEKDLSKFTQENNTRIEHSQQVVDGLTEKCKNFDVTLVTESRNLEELENKLSKMLEMLNEMKVEEEKFEEYSLAYLKACRESVCKWMKL